MPISSPLSLSDAQLTAVMQAAAPLQPRDRASFLEALAKALQAQPVIGDGTVHRAIADTQKRFFNPPLESGFNGAPKYSSSKRR
jgi:hypothetical protein